MLDLFHLNVLVIPGSLVGGIVMIFFKSSIIKLTTLNTNEQEAIGGAVADPAVGRTGIVMIS